MLDLSICIVNTNNIQLLAPCLESIRSHTKKVTYEVIVVDNNSADESVSAIHEHFPFVTLVESKQTRGYTANMNMALRRVSGRYAAMLNDDTALLSDAFSDMVRFLDGHDDVGAASPRMLNPDGTFQIGPRGPSTLWTLACSELKLHRLFPKSRLMSGFEMTYWNPMIPCEVQVMSGACIVVKSGVLDTVGLLDDDISLGPDDLDISHRIRVAGWRLHYAGDVTILHWGGASKLRPEALVKSLISMYFGWYWFLAKHFGWSHARAFRPIAICGGLLRMGYWSLVLATSSARRERAWHEIRGRLAVIALSLSPQLKANVLSGRRNFR